MQTNRRLPSISGKIVVTSAARTRGRPNPTWIEVLNNHMVLMFQMALDRAEWKRMIQTADPKNGDKCFVLVVVQKLCTLKGSKEEHLFLSCKKDNQKIHRQWKFIKPIL